MKLYFDRQADVFYVRLNESKIIESEEVCPGVILDFDDQNHVVGIEILKLEESDYSFILFAPPHC
jgi:uncharacterized protein YuzE